MAEKILVTSAKVLRESGLTNGLLFDFEDLANIILDRKNSQFMDRDEVEDNPKFIQIVSYVIFGYGNDDYVFSYRRANDGRETRLHGARSLGVGGHVNTYDDECADGNLEDCYVESLRREISEELIIDTEIIKQIPLGIIYNDIDDVGKVHLGFVHYIELAKPQVWPKSPEIAGYKWVAPGYILPEKDTFEIWSKMLLENWVRIREIVTEKK
jgi:predicted NUDIX family phosphoesterase